MVRNRRTSITRSGYSGGRLLSNKEGVEDGRVMRFVSSVFFFHCRALAAMLLALFCIANVWHHSGDWI